MSSTPDAALKAEIARLTGAINQHKISQQRLRPFPRSTQVPSTTRDVVIDGITFESSSRSLVRKGLPKPPSAPSKVPAKPIPQTTNFSRTTYGHRLPAHRSYKPTTSSRTGQQRLRNRNMTLDNTRRPAQGRQSNKRTKYFNKPCPRFTTTGACSRGLTCMYQHDPNKIAICWNFLHGNCPNTAESCNLSHDPIPERTPLCVHFANNGRCTRESCPFPHVRVGQRHGVCRDFAVLGYCSKGIDCQMQHVRECPDFAEKGTCSTKGCKLPHVIRANRNRKVPTTTKTVKPGSPSASPEDSATAIDQAVSTIVPGSNSTSNHPLDSQQTSLQDAQLGDEYISLMFNESEDDSDDNVTDTEDEDASGEEEGDDPNLDDDVEISL